MIVSTKGRYALRVIIDLAINGNDEYISLKDISERSLISMKYLESIVSNLNKHEAHDCITLPMWKKLDSVIDSYLESVTIEDLINGKVE